MPKARHPKAALFVRQRLFAGVASFTELEARLASLPDEQTRGSAFEVFAEAYLATQRKHDAANVWPLTSAPIKILQTLGLASQDYGVDGVFQTLLRNFNAYQVKFRTNRPALTWRELSTFMGLADSPHIRSRVLLTNCDELPSVLNERQGFFCIRGSDLDRLEADDFRAIEAWLADAAFTPPKKQPLPHQTEALNALLPALETHVRVSAIMACGTGKTLVALWVAERRRASRILVLVPSLALLRQILHEWLRETNLPSLPYLCVCSDPTVKDGLDAIATPQTDLDFQVSTDAASVRGFLDAPFTGTKVIFSTYQSAHVVGEALDCAGSTPLSLPTAQGVRPRPGAKKIQSAVQPAQSKAFAFDLGIFDEAHKTAGRDGRHYAFALEDARLPIRKRLFLTATPRHYNPRQRDREGDAQLVFSMDKPAVYGPQAFRLTFAEAARRGIICRYKVVISVITSGMLTNELLGRGEVLVKGDAVRARQVANQMALRDAIGKYGVKKVFTFHRDVKSAQSFVSDGPEGIGTHLAPTNSVGRGSRRAVINREVSAPQERRPTGKFETLHVNGTMPTAHRERLMRDFRAAPRAVMTNARCLTEGVDVPAVDMVAFLSPRRSRVDIVQATGRAMRLAPGKTTGYVLVPLYLEQAAGETVEQAVTRAEFDEVWDVLQSLQEQDEVLAEIIREMREERGRTKGFDDARFRERVEILGPEISLEKLRRAISTTCVEFIGKSWDEHFGELEAFKDQFGHCNVPFQWHINRSLGVWVANQRRLKDKGCLNSERVTRLDSLGFVWNPRISAWQEWFNKLREFRRTHGNCDVPQDCPGFEGLCRWVSRQRKMGKLGKLTAAQLRDLDSLGFIWEAAADAAWEARFSELVRFRCEHDHCNVPKDSPENCQMNRWVDKQRQRFKNGSLSAEQARRLAELGLVWGPNEAKWNEMFAQLVDFKQKHNHCEVPRVLDDNSTLGKWVDKQRRFFKAGSLGADRIRRLQTLGFVWNPKSGFWDKMFGALIEYKQEHGDCVVPAEYPKNRRLGAWVDNQRHLKVGSKLSEDRVRKLDELGFVWAPKGDQWESMFGLLREFKDKHGHCNVSVRRAENPALGSWVGVQRSARAKGKIEESRRCRLDEIGFVWTPYGNSWEMMFSDLLEYRRRHGDCNVPDGDPENPRLASWVRTQRGVQKTKGLPKDRACRLNDLGFIWDPRNALWEDMFTRLLSYKGRFGNCDVPSHWHENPQLAGWVGTQRQARKSGKINEERIQRLNDIGFVWKC